MKCPDCFSENYSIIDTDPLLMSCDDCHSTHSISWSTGFWIGYLKKEKEYLTVKCFICGKEMKVTIEDFVIADIGINPIACFKHADEDKEEIKELKDNAFFGTNIKETIKDIKKWKKGGYMGSCPLGGKHK